MAKGLTAHEERVRELRRQERQQQRTSGGERSSGGGAGGGTPRPPRARKRRRGGSSFGQKLRTFLGYVTLLVLTATAVGIIWVVLLFYNVAKDLPTPDALVEYRPGGITEIYATDKDPKTGKNVVLGRVYEQNKKYVPIGKVPDLVKNATISIEDERFYSHHGVDARAMTRALYRNVREGHMGEGGSTLTQQLARTIVASLGRKKTFTRKAQEMMLALQLEKNYSKEQILEMYLNEVYYGENAYGIAAAAEVYFGRKLDQLSVSQAALLAGLPQRPSFYSPYVSMKKALARRNDVLDKMAEQGYIKPEQAKLFKTNGARLVADRPKNEFIFKAPYFTNYVLRQLVDRYGKDAVYKDGMKVYTTLNWKMQQEAERALVNGVLAARGARVTEGALISVEPRTGYIRAMVGGVDHGKNEFNNAVQGRRQPGSAFKVFVYTAAFDMGRFNPYSTIHDGPVSFPGGANGKRYRPQNYGGGYHGTVSLRQALTHSYNIPAVKVANEIGPKNVVTYARKMGITSPLAPDLSIALGSHAVSPLEMAIAYSVFPNHGDLAKPMGIIRVIDSEGVTLENNRPQVSKVVVPETTVAQISSILADVVARGTAAGAKGIKEVPGAHGKTGTTNDNRDAWFVGYTPELSTAVWVCGVRRTVKNGVITQTRYVPMSGVTGGRVCAPIWARFMKAAVPIQRKSGEPIPPAPEKIAPKKTDVMAMVGLKPGGSGNLTGQEDSALPGFLPASDSFFPGDSAEERADPASRNRAARETVSTVVTSSDAPAVVRPAALTDSDTSAPTAAASAATLPPVISRPEPVSAAPRVRGMGITTGGGGSSGGGGFAVTASVRPSMPAAPQEVTVSVCADSGRQATRWCPETVRRGFRPGRAPGRCRTHKPLPGDG